MQESQYTEPNFDKTKEKNIQILNYIWGLKNSPLSNRQKCYKENQEGYSRSEQYNQ